MTSIDDREQQLGAEKLGPALTEEAVIEVKIKAFENAILWDVPGAGVYTLAEATVADRFRD